MIIRDSFPDESSRVCLHVSSDEKLSELGKALSELKIEKAMTGWDLEALEEAVWATQQRVGDSDDESEDEVERMTPAQLA